MSTSAKEEPYHYLQKRVGTIIEELTNDLNDNLTEFRNISKEAYEIEEKVLRSRNNYIRISKEIEGEMKRQREVEGVLEYFEAEIEKLRGAVRAQSIEGHEGRSYAVIGDIDNLINEFNSLVSSIDIGIPNRMNILLNENMNLVNYADSLIRKIVAKYKSSSEKVE